MKPIGNPRNRIKDEQARKAYDQYKTYLAELSIYEEYSQKNALDIMNPFKLARLYKENGIETKDKKSRAERFRKFSSLVEKMKQKDPDIDLTDIGTHKGREIVSDIIYETQGDKDFKAADLSPVAVVEYFSLYVAVGQVNEGTFDKKTVLQKYDISEEMFDRAQNSYQKYKQTKMTEMFNNHCKRVDRKLPDRIVHYTAGALELRPSEAMNDLKMIDVLKGNYTTQSKAGKAFTVHQVSQLIIDRINQNPYLTTEEKNQRISELEIAEYDRVAKNVDEANRLQKTNKYKVVLEENREVM